MINIKPPEIIKNILSDSDFDFLKNHIINKDIKNMTYESSMGRFLYTDSVLSNYCEKLLEFARSHFDSKTLLPTYTLFCHYEGPDAKLFKHKDDNACTYTLDLCLYQTEPWDLYIEDIPYTLFPNEAIAFYGEDQEHWREKFPNPKSQNVGMVFFHFVEPDHWWFTKGKDYMEQSRKSNFEQ